MEGRSPRIKRPALLVATPPETVPKKSKTLDDDICIICQKSKTTKSNPLQQPTLHTWNSLAQKAQEWKDLGTDYDKLYERVQVDDIPKKVHKLCKLDVVGIKLKRAQEAHSQKLSCAAQESDIITDQLQSTEPRVPSSRLDYHSASCVICVEPLEEKSIRNNGGNKIPVKYHRIETENAWKTFVEAVPYVEDEKKRNRMQAVVTYCQNSGGILKAAALDIRYHKDCWKAYCRPVYKKRADYTRGEQRQQREKWVDEKKKEAFQQLCISLRDGMENRKEVYTLRDVLCEFEDLQRDLMIINEEIRNTCDDRHAIRSLRQNLESHFGEEIGFQARYRRNESSIVFFPKHGGAYVESAVNSWGIDSPELIRNVTKLLHYKYRTDIGIPWPCDVNDLKVDNTPNDIHNFVALLADPHSNHEDGRALVEERLQPAVRFLSEGLMHLITGKRQPLQVSISMSVHNLTGSKELIQVLRKLRLGVSYNDVLDELSAWALQERDKSANNSSGMLVDRPLSIRNVDLCPHEIAPGQPCTVVMDNDDFREDGLTGSETSHYTNVIMAQPISSCHGTSVDTTRIIIPTRDVRKSFTCPILAKKTHVGGLRANPQVRGLPYGPEPMLPHRLTAHALVRMIRDKTTVPAFTGYHCSLESNVKKWETYNVKCYAQPPSKEVVTDVMDWCQKVAEIKEMPLLQLVSDQAVYKYIEEARFEDEKRWPRVIGVLGGFHTEMSYLNALGKRYAGSGLQELAVAAGVVAASSAHRALSGKHYNRGMRLHKLVAESLLSMLIQRYIQNAPERIHGMKLLAGITTEEGHDEFIKSTAFSDLVRDIFDEVLTGGSDMATYWISYIVDVEILFQHYHCVRTGTNFNEYLESCRRMTPLIAAYNNINYLRYLSLYYWRMSTLTEDNKTYMAAMYSFSLTGKSYSKLSPDQVIEMTMNKQSKNRRSGGWVGFTKNLSMVAINILSRPVVMRLRELLQQVTQFKKPLYNHPELGPSRLKKDCKVIESVKTILEEWEADPWDLSRPTLRCMCSGQPASDEIRTSLQTAHKEGNAMVENFLERLTTGIGSIHDTIPKRKSKTFVTKTTASASTKQEGRTTVDHNAIKRLIDLLTGGKEPSMSLEELMEYRITSLSLSLFTSDEFFHKPAKSMFMTSLNYQAVTPPAHYHALIDVGMAWNKVSPCKTWSSYAQNLFNYIVGRHANAMAFHFINDIYHQDLLNTSPKQHEQQRRSKSYGFVPNVYPVADQQMPQGSSWRSFLSSGANKQRLQRFLLNEWHYYVHHAKLFFTMDLDCYDIKSGKCDSKFASTSPCEADTRAFFHAAQLDNAHPIVLDFEDTDVWIVASYISHTTDQAMYMYKKKSTDSPSYFNCRSLFPDPDLASAALGIYTFTGVDTVGGFFGCGKVATIKRVLKSNDLIYMETMQRLGVEKELTEELLARLELFTIRIIYNDPVSKRLGHARARKWRLMKRYDTARLPPDHDSFLQHCLRAHFQSYEWRNARCALSLLPSNFGWKSLQNVLQPVPHTTPCLPHDARVPVRDNNGDTDTEEEVEAIASASSQEDSETDEECDD